jgi:hypothetical protein
MTLTTDEYVALARALYVWADAAPDQPALGFLQTGEMLSRQQLFEAFDDQNNPDGAAFLEMLEHAVRREGVERVTGRLLDAARPGMHGDG